MSMHTRNDSDLFVCYRSPAKTLEIHQKRLGERIACSAVSRHLYILSYKQGHCYPPLRQTQSDFENVQQ